MENLKQKSFDAIIWKFAGDIGSQAASFMIGIFLARVIAPNEYGLIATITIFTAISSSVIDSGMSTALVREKNTNTLFYNTVFVFNVTVALLLCLLFTLLAPQIANFYNQDKLILVIRVMSWGFVINAMSLVPKVILSRELKFKKMAVINFPAILISGTVGLFMAYNGYGIWALITQTLLNSILVMSVTTLKSGYNPFVLNFSRPIFIKLFSFSYKLSLSGLLNSFFENIYPIIIGKLYAPADLGYFARADNYKNIAANNITNPLMAVVAPALAAVQNDELRMRNLFKKVIKLAIFINTPVMLLLVILAKPLIIVSITEKWLPTVQLLQILCTAAILFPLHVINLSLILIKGRSDLFFRLELFKKILIVLILLASFKLGMLYFVSGTIFISLAAYFLNAQYSKTLINLSVLDQLKLVYKFLFAGLVTIFICFNVDEFIAGWWSKIFFITPLFLILYSTLCYWFEQETIHELKDMIITKFVPKK
jgi:O-antigen/teichoic acid export membrane protein